MAFTTVVVAMMFARLVSPESFFDCPLLKQQSTEEIFVGQWGDSAEAKIECDRLVGTMADHNDPNITLTPLCSEDHQSFKDLLHSVELLAKEHSNEQKSLQTATLITQPPNSCKMSPRVIFVVGSSNAFGSPVEFQYHMEIVQNFIDEFKKKLNRTQLGLIVYNKGVAEQIQVDNLPKFESQMVGITTKPLFSHFQSGKQLHSALQKLTAETRAEKHLSNDDRLVVVILTNSLAFEDRNADKAAAVVLHNNWARVFAVVTGEFNDHFEDLVYPKANNNLFQLPNLTDSARMNQTRLEVVKAVLDTLIHDCLWPNDLSRKAQLPVVFLNSPLPDNPSKGYKSVDHLDSFCQVYSSCPAERECKWDAEDNCVLNTNAFVRSPCQPCNDTECPEFADPTVEPRSSGNRITWHCAMIGSFILFHLIF